MSNDEYKTSLLNYSRFYYEHSKINYNNNNNNNNRKNNNSVNEAEFPTELDEKYTVASTTTPSAQKPTNRTCDVNHNKNKSNSNINSTVKRFAVSQFVPMNLITNTGLDLSHSIRKPTFTAYFNNESLNQSKSDSYIVSPCSSTSPSIDVENDDNDDNDVNDVDNDNANRIMSSVSIPSYYQKPFINDTRNPSQSPFTNMELTAGSIPSGFPLNYHQYANNTALYGAPVMFSGAIHAAHASYMAGLPLHAALSPNETYLKAIQAAACGIYSPTALVPPTLPSSTAASASPSLVTGKLSSVHASTPMISLTPSSKPMGTSKTPQHHQQPPYSPCVLNNRTDISEQQEKKKDYLGTPLNTQTALRTNATTNGAGTYLNDKVNERLRGVDATKDSHFKVPNGKEGSLKHRLLRPSSNSDGSTTEPSKTPIMRSYNTTLNFMRGNYIELANGALRRVEDMRTEDFIQCAERSPHHQLAESTVVKINTSLPATAVITFSYDRNRSKVDMEVTLDHPFFVYGQGWASCSPEMSMKVFGLKCQRLQVGDICISLTKREQPRQQIPSISHTTQNNSQANDANSYQAKHLAISSANAAHSKSVSVLARSSVTDMPYSAALNAHTFSIPAPQPNQHMQQQQQQQQHHNQQAAYAEMAKFMSSYAYTKGLPQVPHELLKEVVMEPTILQNLPPEMMSAFYQNQIFQLAQQQQQQQQKHLRQSEQQLVSNPNYNVISSLSNNLSPQPSDLENRHIQQEPPQTQPLDVTMSRKRRWSAPENMFDDDECDTQPRRNGSSPTTART